MSAHQSNQSLRCRKFLQQQSSIKPNSLPSTDSNRASVRAIYPLAWCKRCKSTLSKGKLWPVRLIIDFTARPRRASDSIHPIPAGLYEAEPGARHDYTSGTPESCRRAVERDMRFFKASSYHCVCLCVWATHWVTTSTFSQKERE